MRLLWTDSAENVGAGKAPRSTIPKKPESPWFLSPMSDCKGSILANFDRQKSTTFERSAAAPSEPATAARFVDY